MSLDRSEASLGAPEPIVPAPVRSAWLITGLPGAGKSTIARLLAGTMPHAAHIEGDLLSECIVSGMVWPGQEPKAEARRQQLLSVQNQCLLARSFADAGFVPVMEYTVMEKSRLDRYREALADFGLRFVVLNPGREVVLQRDRDRLEKTVAHFWVHLQEVMAKELAGIGLWVDSSSLSARDTVQLILREQERARM